MRFPLSRFIYLFVLGTLLGACNESTTTLNGANSSSGLWTVPGIGTKLIFSSSQTGGFDTLTVVKTGLHVDGKTNVVEIRDTVGGVDSGFYNFEPNGDISFGYQSDTVGVLDWEAFPTWTHKTVQVIPPTDTVSFEEHFVSSDTRSFIGTESITLPSGTFPTLHLRELRISDNFDLLDSTASSTDTETTDYWFATSVGMYVKVIDNDVNSSSGSQFIELELFKYIPR